MIPTFLYPKCYAGGAFNGPGTRPETTAGAWLYGFRDSLTAKINYGSESGDSGVYDGCYDFSAVPGGTQPYQDGYYFGTKTIVPAAWLSVLAIGAAIAIAGTRKK